MHKKLFISFNFVITALLTACISAQTSNPNITLTPTAISSLSPTPSPKGDNTDSQEITADPTPSLDPTLSSELPEKQFIWNSPSADLNNRIVSVDQFDEERIAYCAPHEIRVSDDGGRTWETIPTDGVADAAESNGFDLFENDPSFPLACLSVTLDPHYPNSYYGVFTTADSRYGAPPVFFMGFITNNNGASWKLVPPPPGSSNEDFGGFRIDSSGSVQALFSKPAQIVDNQDPVHINETKNGGQIWKPGELSCPARGPCLRWGPAPSSIPGMGSPLPQRILLSLNSGETWEEITPPAELRAPPPNQLAAFSDEDAAIVIGSTTLSNSGTTYHPYRITQDSGLNWEALPLPSLPVADPAFAHYPGLQILPDGSFLSQTGEKTKWYWLPTRDQGWCALTITTLPDSPVLLRAIGQRLWWVNPDTQQAENIPLSEINCD